MFDALLKSKFYVKCKSAIKLTKTRIEMIKRKRSAMQKYLRKDIADLLKNGLDIKAYGRAEGLLVELNMSACYDFIEQFCCCISKHLSLMNKQRECPEECKGAISSLIFAAARFADLPELRRLRSLFADRYGKALEAYVNQEFVEKLKAMPPTKDSKLQLLQDIALESGLQWDCKALEQKLYNPPVSDQSWCKNTNDDKDKVHETKDEHIRTIENQEVSDDIYKLHDTGNNAICGEDPEKADDKKPCNYKFIPPPYTKPKAGKPKTEISGNGNVNKNQDGSVGEAKPKPKSVRRRPTKPPPCRDSSGSDQGDGAGKEAAKIALRILDGDRHDQKEDEEERRMDRLLRHYSTKESPFEAGKGKETLKPSSLQQSTKSKARARGRTISLPSEPTSPLEIRGHVRASSFQPETEHLHPNLPDYDDFLARLEALRGK